MRPNESFISQPVRSLQTMLRVAAAGDGRNISVIPDGIYGRQTMNEVAGFQRRNGLPITGVTDQKTWDTLIPIYNDALIRVGPAHPLEIVLNPNEIIRRGDSHPVLYLVQSMLLVLSRLYHSVGQPTLSGILDLPTADSLGSFQTLSGLPATGDLDKVTWKHLTLQYPLAVNLQLSGRGVD